MIGFHLTEEQEQMRQLARRFATNEIRPVAAEYDQREETPWELLQQAAQIGLLSYNYPEVYGGGGVDSVLTSCLVAEELSWGCLGVATAILGCGLAAVPILIAGTEAQKARYLPWFCDDRQVHAGAFALTEPDAGSDVAALRTTAVRDGDCYVLNGQKRFITLGGVAGLYALFATVDPRLGHMGITAFIVEADRPGVSAGRKELKMGMRASHTGDVILENVRVPVENRLGEEGQGFFLAMKAFEHTRPVVAACAVGLARAAYEYAGEYAAQRVQFGKPILAKQAVRFLLADMATEIEAARLLTWRAACLADEGRPCNVPASMAKRFAADMAMRVTTDAVQVLGGYGYMREYPVEKWMRDAKVLQIVEGTSQIQRVVISQMLAMGME
ncbi:MAG TPA: acyl-CoA dehydrogenase family protein [Anaerolineae bacterium]|nr:acyl-CoA dehydrogenase family protein [Anaerolineae bacterium]